MVLGGETLFAVGERGVLVGFVDDGGQVGAAERLEATAPPLGLGVDGPIGQQTIAWDADHDLLCLWTDGLVDATDAEGGRFGEARLLERLVALHGDADVRVHHSPINLGKGDIVVGAVAVRRESTSIRRGRVSRRSSSDPTRCAACSPRRS